LKFAEKSLIFLCGREIFICGKVILNSRNAKDQKQITTLMIGLLQLFQNPDDIVMDLFRVHLLTFSVSDEGYSGGPLS
jgi:hypothetical protein